LIALAILFVAGAFILAAMLRRPDMTANRDYLFLDPGTNLLLAERLSEGARLYRDLGYSYGPLAIHPYRIWADVFGNTALSFSAFLGFFSAINIVLAYAVMRTLVSRRTATVVVFAGLLTTILTPGSIAYGYQSSAYSVFERTFFLIVLAIWMPPAQRTTKRAVALGVTLGLWQLLRFGTALFVGLAIVIVDVIALLVMRSSRADIERWLRRSLATLACFLSVEGAWIAFAFATLPASDALDAIWPSFVLEGFTVWPEYLRWPQLISLKHFAAQQLTTVVSALFAIFGCLLVIRRVHASRSAITPAVDPASAVRDFRLVIPFVFYAVGCIALFRAASHFNQYAWLLPLAAALLIERFDWRVGAAFALLTLPTLALNVRINFLNPPSNEVDRVVLPDGSALALSPPMAHRVRMLREYAMSDGGRSLFIVPTGAGFHAILDVPQPTRQSWLIPGFFRAGDEEAVLRILATKPSAIVLAEHPASETPGSDPCTWFEWRHFSTTFCPRLARQLAMSQMIRVDDGAWIIPSVADSVQAAKRAAAAAPVSAPRTP